MKGILFLAILLTGCISPMPVTKVEQTVDIHPLQYKVSYLYATTTTKELLLPPPVYVKPIRLSAHTWYRNDINPYISDLIDYRDYISTHLRDIVEVEDYVDGRLKHRIGCTVYTDHVSGIPMAPKKLDVGGISSDKALHRLLSSYIQKQSEYVITLKLALLDIDRYYKSCYN